MPTPHYGLGPVSRGSTRKGVVRPAQRGGSAAGRAAYIDRGGDHASRADDVLARGHAGPDLGDWTVADRWERRKDAVVAREIIAAVPHWLTMAQQIAVAQEHAEYLRRVHGVCVKWALHRAGEGDQRNTHIHFLLTTRKVSDDGQASETKIKSLERKAGGGDAVAAMRSAWQDTVNAALAAAGRSERLDLRTLAAQGIVREAQQRVPKAEYIRARRGEIRSKRYERNQRLAALKAATDAAAQNGAELTTARRSERRERSRRAVERSQRSVARATRAVAGSQRLAESAARSLRASEDYRRGASAALEQRRRGKRAGPPTVRGKLLRAGVDHVDHAGRERRVHERHPAGIDGDGRAGRPDRRDDASAGGHSERAESRPAAEGAAAAVIPAVVPPAEAKAGFIRRLWRRLTGAADKEPVSAAAPPPVQLNAGTATKASKAREETKVEPPHGESLVVEQASVPIRPDDAAVAEVLKIETPKGGVFYMRKEDWEKRAGKTDVPLCDVTGQPVLAGERAKLRVSSILASKLTPAIESATAREQTLEDASEYLPPPDAETPENVL